MINFKNLLEKVSTLKDKKIITVTLNPVIDRTLWVPNFLPGKTIKIDSTKILAAGKGVNVSRALKLLNIPSIATGILPENGASYYLSLLKRESIDSDFLIVNTEDMVRTNITILSNTINQETHLREKGPKLNSEILDRFKDKLTNLCKKADAVVFSGSLPMGLPDNSYEKLINSIKSSAKLIALDSSGLSLQYGIKAIPTLIKPNINEANDLLNFKPDNTENILMAIDNFTKLGVHHIFISLGKEGLIYSNGNETIKAWVKLEKFLNSVGSGDATLAGSLATIMMGLSAIDIITFSCAMGAANTLSYGACIINLQDLKKVYKKVNLENL